MKLICTLDSKNYTDDMPVVERSSIRAIIEKDGKLLLQQDSNGFYKISGGGPEGDESHLATLAREVMEEIGRIIIPETAEEIGYIDEVRADIHDHNKKYICHTYYYKVDVKDVQCNPCMTASELERGFHPAEATLNEIVEKNQTRKLYADGVDDKDTVFLRWYRANR